MSARPRISIVTPVYNGARFLDRTIESIHGQGYPNLEHIVVDGGSEDGSVEIIRRHADKLTWWCSEPDRGMYDAINKGFARSTGQIMAWLNSDDLYTPWALSTVAQIFSEQEEVEWLTSLFPMVWDEDDRAARCRQRAAFTKRGFMRGEYLPFGRWYASGAIQQETTFWRRSLWERAGGRLDDSLRLAGDFELWARFFEHAPLYGVDTPLGGYRNHDGQLMANYRDQYLQEAEAVLARHGGRRYGRWSAALGRCVQHMPWRMRRLTQWLPFLRAQTKCVNRQSRGGWSVVRI